MAYPTFRFRPNYFYTTLDGALTAITATVTVLDNTDAVAAPGVIVVNNEEIYYTTKGTNTFTGLTRGYNDTAADSHADGAEVGHPISTDYFAKIWDGIEALYGGKLDIVTTKGDILVASAADTLARLAIGSNGQILSVATDTPGWTNTLTKPVINGTNPTGATYTPATGAQTVALDCAANNMHVVTGHASGTSITFTVANVTNNQPFIVSILQGAVVSTITAWFATIRWAGGSAPTLTATVNKRDTFGFIRTGADTYDGFIVGQNS